MDLDTSFSGSVLRGGRDTLFHRHHRKRDVLSAGADCDVIQLSNVAPGFGFFSQVRPSERVKTELDWLEKHSGSCLFSPVPLEKTVLVLWHLMGGGHGGEEARIAPA